MKRLMTAAALAATLGSTVAGLQAQADGNGGGAAAAAAIDPRHVRVYTDEALACAFADGLHRSPTLRALAARVGELNGMVVLSGLPWRLRTGQTPLLGGVAHRVTISGQMRILEGRVVAYRGDQTIATIGHELRHAVEILESRANNGDDVGRLYQRIGYTSGVDAFETAAALQAGRTVMAELRRDRSPSICHGAPAAGRD
jgi:hypothetical protein